MRGECEGFSLLLSCSLPSLPPPPSFPHSLPSFFPSFSLMCNIIDFYNLVERKNHWECKGNSHWSDCSWEDKRMIRVEGLALWEEWIHIHIREKPGLISTDVLVLWSELVGILLGLFLIAQWKVNLHWEQGERCKCWSDYNSVWLTTLFSQSKQILLAMCSKKRNYFPSFTEDWILCIFGGQSWLNLFSFWSDVYFYGPPFIQKKSHFLWCSVIWVMLDDSVNITQK